MTAHFNSSEEFAKKLGGNRPILPKFEIKVRKNEMKLRKKDFEVPKNFSFPRWIFRNHHREIFDFLGDVR